MKANKAKKKRLKSVTFIAENVLVC